MPQGTYPLLFEPIFKPRIWGGQRLQRLVGKETPPGAPIGESWELVDLDEEQSQVREGPERGRTLAELVKTWGRDLLGGAPLAKGRFPLLIKFLDAGDRLSVQVHPSAEVADRMGGSARIKHEAWYVLHAEPGSFIHHGLVEGVSPERLRRAALEGGVEALLRRVDVRPGHCYDLPSGTVHALGAGIVVAEVQTPSDVTYRLYDWDRKDAATGKPRELHVEQAVESACYTATAPEQAPQHTASVWASVTSLCRSPSFVIERVRIAEGVEIRIPHAEMVVWIVLEGEGTITHRGAGERTSFRRGDTVLLPAGLRDGCVRTDANCLWLEVTVPVPGEFSGMPRVALGSAGARGGAERYVPLTVPRQDARA